MWGSWKIGGKVQGRKNEERREWKKEAKTQEILNPVIDFVRIMENREKRRGKKGINGKKKLQLYKEVSFEGFGKPPLD